jgi:carboxyl-terminal processing protease
MSVKPYIQKLIFFSLIILLSSACFAQEAEQVRKFRRVLSLIENFYVDSVNADELTEAAIVAMLKELDPHSVYMDKKEFIGRNEPLQGNFEGIGIQFNILKDTIMVVSTISGGPSEKVGLKAGDRIIKVDNENVTKLEITNSGVRKRLLGKKGSKVNIEVKRPGLNRPLKFTIVRDKIPIYSLDAAYMIDGNTAYIKLNRFAVTTHDEFLTALADLKLKGMKHLILDLGGNGGGYLNIAIKLADELLARDRLIVYTEGLNNPMLTHKATDTGILEQGRLVVMIDEGSASASEIVSGAVQDWDRGVLVGRRSFGKGLVQRQIKLFDSTAIRLTIAHYYTPTGRSIQKSYDNGLENYYSEVGKRLENGELTEQDSINFRDSVRFQTLESGRNVYGGGGIMPDIFVPMDTTYFTDLYVDLVSAGVLNRVAVTYVDANRDLLKSRYQSLHQFAAQFNIDISLDSLLWLEAAKESIVKDTAQYTLSERHIQTQLKALIARDIFGISEYYELSNPLDPAYRKALEIIANKRKYKKILK